MTFWSKWMRRCSAAAAGAALLGGAMLFAQEPMPPTPTRPTLPEVEVEANPVPSLITDDNVYDPVVEGYMFGAPIEPGYRATESTTGSIIAIPDEDLPATVNVVTRDLMNDQIALSTPDVFRNVPSAFSLPDFPFGDRLIVRGMELNSGNFRRDGFSDPTQTPRDFQSIERVEILKGPASVLYGAGSPAGLVNLITKKPMDVQFSNFGMVLGSFQQQRYTVDTNGYASESGNVIYRVNLASENRQSFRDFDFVNRSLVAPSITWKLDDATRLTYMTEWHRDHRRGDQGIPAIGGNPLAVSNRTYEGVPSNDFLHYEEFRQTLLYTHEMNENWTLQMGMYSLFNQVSASTTGITQLPPPFPDPSPFAYRLRQDFRAQEQSQNFQVNLAGDGELLGMRNRMLIGGEYIYFDSNDAGSFGYVADPVPFPQVVDPFNPTHTAAGSVPLLTSNFPAFRQNRVGGYFQDLVDVNDNWKVLGGVRLDSLDLTFNRTIQPAGFPPLPELNSQQNFYRASPRAGIVYQPYGDESMAWYFNYTQSFAPPTGGIYFNTNNLQPVTGNGYEAGVKTELWSGLTVNACGYYATRNNADFQQQSFALVQIGEERSRGAELNAIGQVTDRWSLVANYGYNDTRLYDIDPQFNGNRQRGVPYNAANLWSRYNFIQDEDRTVGAAIGMYQLGQRPGDLQNTFNLPGFVRWDAGLYYKEGPMYATLYAENILDINYAAASVNSNQVYPGTPANVRAMVGFVW